jgi:ATP-binding cassette subfamily B protein
VLDKGEIKEQGTHTELLEKIGWYAQLHKMQYKEVAR